MNFYSEYREDQWIWKHILIPARGFYVDLGCANPGHGNNTEFLREMGWKGLAIDGNKSYADAWTGKAEFVNAVVARPDQTVFWKCVDASLSRAVTPDDIGKPGVICIPGCQIEIIPATLDGILQSKSVDSIDVLSIDIEGAEFDALQTLDLKVYRPKIIISEFNTHGIGKDYRVFEYLMATGDYMAVHQTMANIIYLRR